jgi:hypothetical protein
MLPAPTPTAVILPALLAASAPFVGLKIGRSALKTPPWVAFAVLIALGTASLLFGLLNPELIAAAFYEG